MFKISDLKPTDEIFVFDTLYNETRPTLYTVRDFINDYKERPEDFGKAYNAWKKTPDLDKEEIKSLLSDYFADRVIESEYFYGGDDFTTDDLWENRKLLMITRILECMLGDSGYFLEPGRFEVDYSELALKKPEAEPDPAPSRTVSELQPCPCCGSEKVAFSTLWHYVIRCNDCGISTMMVTTRDEAISIWNRRVNSEKEKNQCGTT